MKIFIETYPLPSGEGGGYLLVSTLPGGVGELGAGVHACLQKVINGVIIIW